MLRACFFLHKSDQAIEIVGPEVLIAIEPGERLAHRFGGEPAGHDTSGLLARDQGRVRQHVEMFHDGRQ
jgi:hypothetical protein